MNTRINKRLLSAGFALSLGLMACQENNLVTPDKPLNESRDQAINQPAQPTDNILSRQMVYHLTQDGSASLIYDNEGRLTQVSSGQPLPSPYHWVQTYTYSSGAIHALVYMGTQLKNDQTFLLDAKGRCYESIDLHPGDVVVGDKTVMVYSYNAKGQLVTATNKSNPVIHAEYSYNADGDLFRIMHFNPARTDNPFGITVDYTLSYDQPTGQPLLADQYGFCIDEEEYFLPSRYLKIYGVPSKHLVKRITEKYQPTSSGFDYTYTLNAEGYPTKRVTHKLNSSAVYLSKSYDYLISKF